MHVCEIRLWNIYAFQFLSCCKQFSLCAAYQISCMERWLTGPHQILDSFCTLGSLLQIPSYPYTLFFSETKSASGCNSKVNQVSKFPSALVSLCSAAVSEILTARWHIYIPHWNAENCSLKSSGKGDSALTLSCTTRDQSCKIIYTVVQIDIRVPLHAVSWSGLLIFPICSIW